MVVRRAGSRLHCAGRCSAHRHSSGPKARPRHTSWYGNPRVSAARTHDLLSDGRQDRYSAETNSVENMEHWGGAHQIYAGPGQAGYAQIHQDLVTAGHGSSAFVGVYWPEGGGHAFAAVNHQGTVYWVDPQAGVVSRLPIHGNAAHVNYIPLDSAGKPMWSSYVRQQLRGRTHS